MEETPERSQADPERVDPTTAGKTSRPAIVLLVVGGSVIVVLIALAVLLLLDWRSSDQSTIEQREDPIADLLSWIPANRLTVQSFSAWTPESGFNEPDGIGELQDQLAIIPFPLTLGHSPDWEDRFGWQMGDVSGWAVAGNGAEIAVLEGNFDQKLIEERLLASGYQRGLERGYSVYSISDLVWEGGLPEGDDASRAMAIGIVGDRVITASSFNLLRDAIDVVLDGSGSLADQPAVERPLQAIAPVGAIVVIDQANHSAGCLPDRTLIEPPLEKAQFVIVGYGRSAENEQPRTTIAVTFESDEAAARYFPAFESGWIEGYANAGGVGGEVDAFGLLSVVSQRDSTLVAVLVDGRDEGWVRSGIRFAIPVCEATMAIFPAGTPDPTRGQADLSIADRLLESLPLVTDGGIPVVIDIEAASKAGNVPVPGSDATVEDIATWEQGIGPQPPLQTFLLEPDVLLAWSTSYGIALSSVRGVGESVVSERRPPVGVLIGEWNLESLTARLSKLGYDWIDLGDVRHFAYDGPSPAMELPNVAFRNIAVYGDRMWFSDDQQLMRDMIEAAIGD